MYRFSQEDLDTWLKGQYAPTVNASDVTMEYRQGELVRRSRQEVGSDSLYYKVVQKPSGKRRGGPTVRTSVGQLYASLVLGKGKQRK